MLPIPLYEGRYSITSTGKIYSNITSKFLKPLLDKDGYFKVNLYSGGRGSMRTYRICRLVASTYLLPDPLRVNVNHKDGDKQNDDVSNLEWVTTQENSIHAWATGLCKPYDRKLTYNKEGIINSNKARKKWFGTRKEYYADYYKRNKQTVPNS